MASPVVARINQQNLLHNLNVVKQTAPNSNITAMVKANAYGHGLENIAPVLQEHVDSFAVARLDPALILRSLNITKPILIMAGFYLQEQLEVMSANNFIPLIHSECQIEMLEACKLDAPISVWLKVDTGMGRLGFLTNQVESIYQRLTVCGNIKKIGLMTHFPDADDMTKPTTKNQINIFAELSAKLNIKSRSLAKSAGILGYPDSHNEWVRPGIMLYGASPIAGKTAADLNLKPVMTLTAPVIAVRDLPKGSTVGYGGTFVCPEDMQIAVVGVGYGDGYPRHAKQGAPVLLNGKLVPRIGRVCMDMIMLDLRECPEVQVGDRVTLWGEGLPADEVAKYADTIAYDLFCGVSRRVHFEVHAPRSTM
jgi:alanine racemase